MFSSTAYEAFYTYIGLHLHSQFIKVITSQGFFIGALTLIFGVFFFFTAWKFFANYLPPVFAQKSGANLGSFLKLLACLFLGVTILKVDAGARIKKFDQTSWHTNKYITTKLPDIAESYQVSFVFDLITRASSELSRYASHIVDNLFKVTNSETKAPSYFYKAIVFAGSQTIEDPGLRDKVSFYTSECLSKVLPLISAAKGRDKLDVAFSRDTINPMLRKITIDKGSGMTCLHLKNEMRQHLLTYAKQKTRKVPLDYLRVGNWGAQRMDEFFLNLVASKSLVNHYLNQKEGFLGIQKASLVPGTTARLFQYFNRVFSFDGFLELLGHADKQGAATTASRSQAFSEHLKRAPHIQGFIKMLLIMIFPWLIFFVVAGKWRVLIYWSVVYTSVLLWTPIWCLFYHITTSIALSTDTMQAFGELSDGISLYGSQLITSRLYHYYAIYSWAQLAIGPLPTLIVAWNLAPLIKDNAEESAPEFMSETQSLALETTSLAKKTKTFVEQQQRT